MPTAKVAITIDERLLREVDRWVASGEFPNRSKALQEALLSFRQQRTRGRRLLGELAKLDRQEERALAEEALAADVAWPES
ncbi:MAG: CopG family transcriptional regulator [Chloroflexi bacterium]|nr:CopG family transcriptional regulator [Chloroflexota bacterium]